MKNLPGFIGSLRMTNYRRVFNVSSLVACLALFLSACTNSTATTPIDATEVSQFDNADIGQQFVKLALALGVHDGDYVDAYHGPKVWRDNAKQEAIGLEEIVSRAQASIRQIQATRIGSAKVAKRYTFLLKQFESLQSRAKMLNGELLTFDEESIALYDAVSPHHSIEYYEERLQRLEQAIPGNGSLPERIKKFRAAFEIPPENLDRVFKEAIRECRSRTVQFIDLPDNERFIIEYVTDKPWSGYNWFQGDAYSLIQVNTDYPVLIDRAVDLACLEGYPGHHVYNTLLEKHLLKDEGWQEFMVFPLFSPTGLIAEGSANYGIDMAFPGDERIEYEENVLFDLAGLDTSRVREYYLVESLLQALKYAGNDIARRYLDGNIDATTAASELEKYALMPTDKAKQRVAFIDKYRAYVINYNLGRDIVATWIESGSERRGDRWKRFEQLLSQPYLPSMLIKEAHK